MIMVIIIIIIIIIKMRMRMRMKMKMKIKQLHKNFMNSDQVYYSQFLFNSYVLY